MNLKSIIKRKKTLPLAASEVAAEAEAAQRGRGWADEIDEFLLILVNFLGGGKRERHCTIEELKQRGRAK